MTIDTHPHVPWDVTIESEALGRWAAFCEVFYASDAEAARRLAAEQYPDATIASVARRRAASG